MKLLTATGEEAIELLADLIDPFSEIASDADISHALRTNQTLKAVKFGMKKHPKTIREILAICEGVPFEEYHPSALEIPVKLLEILNNKEVSSLFTLQEQTEATGSGTAMEVTQA